MKNKIQYIVLGIFVVTSSVMAQVFLNKYKPDVAALENETVYNETKDFVIVTDGFLYQFPGASDNYFGNYRMAVIRDKKNGCEYIVTFNDKSIAILPRKKLDITNDK